MTTPGQHGGARQPTNPAPASGPGALSQRTDGQQPTMDLPNAEYGEDKAFRQAQQAGPIPQQTNGAANAGEEGASPVETIPFGSPSSRPDEPVTAGTDAGPGPDSRSLGLLGQSNIEQQDAQYLAQYLSVFEELANRPEASPSTRIAVRRIKAALG